jgi:hypothetical protein
VQDEVMRTEGFLNSSCAGLTRASIYFARTLTKWMDCRVKPGNDSEAVVPAKAGLSLRSAGTTSLGPSELPTNSCAKGPPGQFHCFGIVIYNESCNSNVSGRRGRCVTPYVNPRYPRCGTIRRHPMCHRHNVIWI